MPTLLTFLFQDVPPLHGDTSQRASEGESPPHPRSPTQVSSLLSLPMGPIQERLAVVPALQALGWGEKASSHRDRAVRA